MTNFQAESSQLSDLHYDDSTSSGPKNSNPSKTSNQSELECDSGKRTKKYYGMVLIINIAKGNTPN